MRQLPAWLHEPRENLVDAMQRQRDQAVEQFRRRWRPWNAHALAALSALLKTQNPKAKRAG